jgi:hypothetical protein
MPRPYAETSPDADIRRPVYGDICIDIVTVLANSGDVPAHQGRLSRGHFRKAERDAVPARGFMRSAPGRPRGTGRPAKRPVCTERT